MVQTNVHHSGTAAVHPGSPFPVSVATVMAHGAAPPQTVLLTSPPTRSLTPERQQHIYPLLLLAATASAGQRLLRYLSSTFKDVSDLDFK